MNDKFQEIGNYLIQIGLYLCTINNEEFERQDQVKSNITNFLIQTYVYLKNYNDISIIDNKETLIKEEKEQYLSRKEVIELYHPLFTDYGLNQLIHTKGISHIKRGSKYFFKKSEIDKWLEENGKNDDKTRVRYV